jgi:hypothetical protein
MQGGVEAKLHAFLTSALDGSSQFITLGAFSPMERNSCTHWTGCWVGHSRPGHCEEQKLLLLLPGIKPRFLERPSHSVVTISTELLSTMFPLNIRVFLFKSYLA